MTKILPNYKKDTLEPKAKGFLNTLNKINQYKYNASTIDQWLYNTLGAETASANGQYWSFLQYLRGNNGKPIAPDELDWSTQATPKLLSIGINNEAVTVPVCYVTKALIRSARTGQREYAKTLDLNNNTCARVLLGSSQKQLKAVATAIGFTNFRNVSGLTIIKMVVNKAIKNGVIQRLPAIINNFGYTNKALKCLLENKDTNDITSIISGIAGSSIKQRQFRTIAQTINVNKCSYNQLKELADYFCDIKQYRTNEEVKFGHTLAQLGFETYWKKEIEFDVFTDGDKDLIHLIFATPAGKKLIRFNLKQGIYMIGKQNLLRYIIKRGEVGLLKAASNDNLKNDIVHLFYSDPSAREQSFIEYIKNTAINLDKPLNNNWEILFNISNLDKLLETISVYNPEFSKPLAKRLCKLAYKHDHDTRYRLCLLEAVGIDLENHKKILIHKANQKKIRTFLRKRFGESVLAAQKL